MDTTMSQLVDLMKKLIEAEQEDTNGEVKFISFSLLTKGQTTKGQTTLGQPTNGQKHDKEQKWQKKINFFFNFFLLIQWYAIISIK